MEIKQIIYRPSALVKFTAVEVNALFAASAHHYDGLCRQQSERGGLLFGMRNCLETDRVTKTNFHESVEWRLSATFANRSTSEPEQLPLVYRNSTNKEILGIPFSLGQIFKQLNDEYTRLNP